MSRYLRVFGGRRHLLLATVAVAVGLVVTTVVITGATFDRPAPPIVDQDADESDDGYVVVQGEECTPIEPLGNGSQSAEAFYDYRTPDTEPSSYDYSSHGTTDLQEDDTSLLGLFEGDDGLSLLIVHDRYQGETAGGSVTFQIDDLPEEGEWVVEDDHYDDRDDAFEHEATSSRITWIWTGGRTDGAMFTGGLDDDFAIRIDPAFNEDADFRETDGGYDGQLTNWQALSGPDEDLERTDLDTSESVVIRSGGC